MATYTKETALYDTGAIAGGIEDAGNEYKKNITNITTIGNTGVKVHPYDSAQGQAVTSDYALIDSTGMTVVENNTQRAKFGATTIIGKPYVSGENDNESHVEIDFNSLKMIDKEGEVYLHISDLRNQSGVADISVTYLADGFENRFYTMRDSTIISVTVNGAPATYSQGTNYVSISPTPSANDEIAIHYTTTSVNAKAYTLGKRVSTNAFGSLCVAEGYSDAIGHYSHSEGYETCADGQCSHSEGRETKAEGTYSHAEGYKTKTFGSCSHAEGANTVTSSAYAHAEGYETSADARAHSQNWGTVADKFCATALGTFNKKDTGASTHPDGDTAFGAYAVMVGNGTSDTARSNAFDIKWNGDTRAYGKIFAQNHYSAIGTTGTGTRSSTADTVGTTYKTIASLELTAGTWLLTGYVSFNGTYNGNNVTAGTRRVLLTSDPEGSYDAAAGSSAGYVAAATQIVVRTNLVVTPTSNTYYYLRARSSTNVDTPYGNVTAVRIA